jgi:hypothetical protein
MRMYKVIFDNNKAILASQIDFSNNVGAEIAYPDGKSTLKWLIIFANDEKDSIITANKIAGKIGLKS